jgi:hypothetical protein
VSSNESIKPFGSYVLVAIEREQMAGAIHIPDAAQGLARARVVAVGPQVQWAAPNMHVLPHPAAAMLHVPGEEDLVLLEEAGLLAEDARPHVSSARVIAEPVSPVRRKRPVGGFQ